MRRLFWVALGATAGVLVVRKLSKTVEAYTPEGVGRSIASLGDALREAAEVVREGMAEREHELRLALGVDAGEGAGELDADRARTLLDNPFAPRHQG
jgi:Family of unknown function (DUF6167)